MLSTSNHDKGMNNADESGTERQSMTPERSEPQFIDDERGGVTTSYGPFMLKSAFQPIFSQSDSGQLTIRAFEALIRPFRAGRPVSPGQFFPAVEAEDAHFIDRLCRDLHLRNMGRLGRHSARLFLNFNPSLYGGKIDFGNEVAGIVALCNELGLSPGRIVCEITEQGSDEHTLADMVAKLRGSRFKIAVDDYGAEESDLHRVDRLRPDVVKLDAAWVRRYSETSAGRLLLRQLVERFRERGITSLFEGLEEEFQVSFCREIGVDLLQGFVLARPEIFPTSFNIRFPESSEAETPQAPSPTSDVVRQAPPQEPRAEEPRKPEPVQPRRTVPFGRRGR